MNAFRHKLTREGERERKGETEKDRERKRQRETDSERERQRENTMTYFPITSLPRFLDDKKFNCKVLFWTRILFQRSPIPNFTPTPTYLLRPPLPPKMINK